MSSYAIKAFGLEVLSEFELPGGRCVGIDGAPGSVVLHLDTTEAVKAPPGMAEKLIWQTELDDVAYRMTLGADDSYRFAYGERDYFTLSHDGATLSCAPARFDEPAWQRLLLDTVLWSVSALRGTPLFHASAVALDGRAYAFVSASGGGKTTLALELVRRGATLLCDDVVALTRGSGGAIEASPSPAVANVPYDSYPSPGEFGRVLARSRREAWVELRRAAWDPVPFGGVYLLERGCLPPLGGERAPVHLFELLPHAFGFRADFERSAGVFNGLADLLCEVPVGRLPTPAGTTPAQLADVVEAAVPTLLSATV